MSDRNHYAVRGQRPRGGRAHQPLVSSGWGYQAFKGDSDGEEPQETGLSRTQRQDNPTSTGHPESALRYSCPVKDCDQSIGPDFQIRKEDDQFMLDVIRHVERVHGDICKVHIKCHASRRFFSSYQRKDHEAMHKEHRGGEKTTPLQQVLTGEERTRLEAERDATRIERDTVRTELQTVREERDTAGVELDKAQKERDAAKVELNEAQKEQDTARTELNIARKERDIATSERDTTKIKLNTAQKERDAAKAALQQQQPNLTEDERTRLEVERDTARIELNTARGQRDTARRERDAADTTAQGLRIKLDAAEAAQAEAATTIKSTNNDLLVASLNIGNLLEWCKEKNIPFDESQLLTAEDLTGSTSTPPPEDEEFGWKELTEITGGVPAPPPNTQRIWKFKRRATKQVPDTWIFLRLDRGSPAQEEEEKKRNKTPPDLSELDWLGPDDTMHKYVHLNGNLFEIPKIGQQVNSPRKASIISEASSPSPRPTKKRGVSSPLRTIQVKRPENKVSDDEPEESDESLKPLVQDPRSKPRQWPEMHKDLIIEGDDTLGQLWYAQLFCSKCGAGYRILVRVPDRLTFTISSLTDFATTEYSIHHRPLILLRRESQRRHHEGGSG